MGPLREGDSQWAAYRRYAPLRSRHRGLDALTETETKPTDEPAGDRIAGRRGDHPAQSMLVEGFLQEYHAMVARWAAWALAYAYGWPDDIQLAPADLDVLEALACRKGVESADAVWDRLIEGRG